MITVSGFDLASYPAVGDWLARIRDTPQFAAMPKPEAELVARFTSSDQA